MDISIIDLKIEFNEYHFTRTTINCSKINDTLQFCLFDNYIFDTVSKHVFMFSVLLFLI